MRVKKGKNRIQGIYYSMPFETFFWIFALTLLAFYNPLKDQHQSLCILKGLGFEYCPGCGLGRSVSLILHGDFSGSLSVHPLGFPALGILLYRSFRQIIEYARKNI